MGLFDGAFGRGVAAAALGAQTGAIKGEAEGYRRQNAANLMKLRLLSAKQPKEDLPYDVKAIIDLGNKVYSSGTAEEKNQFEQSGFGPRYRATLSLLGSGLSLPAVRAGSAVTAAASPEEAAAAMQNFQGLADNELAGPGGLRKGDQVYGPPTPGTAEATTPGAPGGPAYPGIDVAKRFPFVKPSLNSAYQFAPGAKETAQTKEIQTNTARTETLTPLDAQVLQQKVLDSIHGRTLDEKNFNLKAAVQDFSNAVQAFKLRHGAGEDDLHDKIKIAQYLLQGARLFQSAGATQQKALQGLIKNQVGLGITTLNPAAVTQMLKNAGYDDNFIGQVLNGAGGGAAGAPSPAGTAGSPPLQQGAPAGGGTGNQFSDITLHGQNQPVHLSPNQIPGQPPVLPHVPGQPGPVNTAGMAGGTPGGGLGVAPINGPAGVPQTTGPAPHDPLGQVGLVTPASAPNLRVNYAPHSLEDRVARLYVNGTLSGEQIVGSFPHGSPEQAAALRVVQELNSQLYRNQFPGLPSAETNGAMLPGNTNFAGTLGYPAQGIGQVPLTPLIPNVGIGQPAPPAAPVPPAPPAASPVWNDQNTPPLSTLPPGVPLAQNSYVPPAPAPQGGPSVFGMAAKPKAKAKPAAKAPAVMEVKKAAPPEGLARVPAPPIHQGEISPMAGMSEAAKKRVAVEISALRREPYAPAVNRWLLTKGDSSPIAELNDRRWVKETVIPKLKQQGWTGARLKAGLYEALVSSGKKGANGNNRLAQH